MNRKNVNVVGRTNDALDETLFFEKENVDTIKNIIWATGYVQDFSWLKVDVFDADGKPAHDRGVAKADGIYFLGLPWLSMRGSSFIWGVWEDAKYLAAQISARS